MSVQNYIDMLGYPVRDKVTGKTGIVTSMAFDLYGCILAVVHPGLDEKGKVLDTIWFDVQRLEITGGPVMAAPDFERVDSIIAEGKKGPSEKPPMMRG